MRTDFNKLNKGWDAEPGAPAPEVHREESSLRLTFFLNASLDGKIREYDRGELLFKNCWRYRLGPPNDEGWDMGQCRFRCLALEWGDFYEVTGDLLDDVPDDWILIEPAFSVVSRHFLFYFKDETFECDADGWSFRILPISDADYMRLTAAEVRIALPRTSPLGFLGDLKRKPIR